MSKNRTNPPKAWDSRMNPNLDPLINQMWHPDRVWAMWESQSSFLKGKVLTVVDASIADTQQRKAIKDLIHQQFAEQAKHVYECCYGTRMLCSAGEEMKPSSSPTGP